MKLGSFHAGGRDGRLIVVSRDLTTVVAAPAIALTLQAALDDWDDTAPRLAALARSLEDGDAEGAFALDSRDLAAPSCRIRSGPSR